VRRLVVSLSLVGLVFAACGDMRPPIGKVEEKRDPAPAGVRGETLLRFAVLGDFGTGGDKQMAVARKMCRWRRQHPFGLVLTTGDNIYPDGHPSYFDTNFFEPYRCLFDNGVRFRSSLGNHDVITDNGRPELDEPAFGLKRRNYVVRKNGVRFVVADSNNVRRRWMRRALKSDPGDRWKIVVFHHPVHSAGEHGSTPGLEDLPRMFRKRNVDLVLNGHEHQYSVTRPLRKIRYVVTGGGGADLYRCEGNPKVTTCKKRHHFLYVTASTTDLFVRAVAPRGGIFHRFRTRGR
jgi:hypothetical protein